MTARSSRDTEYVLIRDRKPKNRTHYYDDDDDDNDSQITTATRRMIQTKPTKDQRIKYIPTDELESDYRRQRVARSNDRGLKVRNTTNGEQVVLDENDNVIKIIRNARTPTPPLVENRRPRIRPRESRALYYETSDGHLVAHSSKNHALTKPNHEFIYAEDEPTKILRKVIIDPKTGERQTIYEKDKPKKQSQPKYVIRKSTAEIPVDSDDEYESPQQPQYVQVVQRRTAPTQVMTKQETPKKYMMIRKKVDSEPVYPISSSTSTVKNNNRRIVYETPTKKPSTTYVYSTDGKYYK